VSLLTSSLKITVSRVTQTALSFLGIVYFARELGAAELGVFFLFQALYNILNFVGDIGLSGAMVKRVSEGSEPGRVLTTGLLVKLPGVGVVVVAVVALQGMINSYFGAELALLLAVGVFLTSYSSVAVKILQAELEMGYFAFLLFLQTVIFVGVGAVLINAGFGVRGLVLGLILSDIVIIVSAGLLWSTPLRRPGLEHARSLFGFSKFQFVMNLTARGLSWADVLVIGAVLSQAHVGAYEVAWRASKPAVLLTTAVGNVTFPRISGLSVVDDAAEIRELVGDGLALALLLPIPALFGAILFSSEILNFIFGESYGVAWLVLIVLMAGRVTQSVFLILQRTLQGLDQVHLLARAAVIVFVVNLVGNVVLVSTYGIVGAAVASAISFALYAALEFQWLSRSVPISIDRRLVATSLLASVVMAIGLGAVDRFVEIQNVQTLVGLIAAGALVYGGIVWADPYVRRTIRGI